MRGTFRRESRLDISKRVHDGVLVFDLEGKLAGAISGGGGLTQLVLDQLADDEGATPNRVLLNLADCAGADSLGIGELISLHVSLSNRGGTLKLLQLPERIRDLLQATQLIGMFEIFEDEEAALQSFG